MPERIQLRRTKGWRKPDGAVVVARPTKWGNPFRWQDYPALRRLPTGAHPSEVPIGDTARRRQAAQAFEQALVYGVGKLDGYPTPDEIRRELRGKDLACWCPPGESCHADVLLQIANSNARLPGEI